MVVRVDNDRLVQISDRRTFAKHSHGAGNQTGRCGTCVNPGTSTLLAVGCYDAYSANTNSNRFWLGPVDEVDPWTGLWNPFGSYFDRGDPEVAFPQNQDGIRSLTSGAFADPVKNRIVLRETDLLAPGQFYRVLHIVCEGEHRDLRMNNSGYRGVTPSWNGTTWSFAEGPTTFIGSVLDAWPGATVGSARNGDDDGHFFVAVKVTQPSPGLWHYEYAVQDFDNARGAAALRIPLCPSTAAQNVGFRDADSDPLNDWTWSHAGSELVFQAGPAALRWNMIFNFWFDCGVAPVAGAVALDQALPGPGALQVAVATQIPGGTAAVADLGPGCGTPEPAIAANGLPLIPSPGFGLTIATTPSAGLILFWSLTPASVPLGNGCTQYLDSATMRTQGFVIADGSGHSAVPVPVPNSLAFDGLPLHWQAVQLVPGGPMLGAFTLSNGLFARVGCR
jgi:hypothetical protein